MENTKQKDNITFDDFLKLDVRICEVIKARRVDKSDKLIELSIDTGFDLRIAVTNLGEFLGTEHFEGKLFPFMLNLEPRKVFGIMSNAMILASIDNDGGVETLESDAEAGSVII